MPISAAAQNGNPSLNDGVPVLKQPPGPRHWQMLSTFFELRRDLLKFSTRMFREYGDFVRFRIGPKQLFLLSHPRHVRYVLCDNSCNYRKGLGLTEARLLFGEGLLTSEGRAWNESRTLFQAAFSADCLERYSQIMAASALDMVQRWRQHTEKDVWIDVAHEATLLTLEILGRTLFGTDLRERAAEIAADLRMVTDSVMARMRAFVPTPRNFCMPGEGRARGALKRLEALVDEMWREQARLGQGTRDNLLTLFAGKFGWNLTSQKHTQLRDEILTFLLVGHETTSALITWVCNLVAWHPEIRRALETELDEVLQGRAAGLSDVPLLVKMRMVLQESLRLYPSVWMIPRKAIQSDCVGGFTIPPGSEVLLNIYCMQRHPQFWDKPDQFDPQRFALHGSQQEVQMAYLPFGSGARACIGSRFALLEATMVLSTIFQFYQLNTEVGPRAELEAALTLRPKGSLQAHIQRRLFQVPNKQSLPRTSPAEVQRAVEEELWQ